MFFCVRQFPNHPTNPNYLDVVVSGEGSAFWQVFQTLLWAHARILQRLLVLVPPVERIHHFMQFNLFIYIMLRKIVSETLNAFANGWQFQLKNDCFLDDEALEKDDSSDSSDEDEFLLLRMNSNPEPSMIPKRFSSYFCCRWNFIFARFALIFAAGSLALPYNEFLKWQALLQTYELYAVNHMLHMIGQCQKLSFLELPVSIHSSSRFLHFNACQFSTRSLPELVGLVEWIHFKSLNWK